MTLKTNFFPLALQNDSLMAVHQHQVSFSDRCDQIASVKGIQAAIVNYVGSDVNLKQQIYSSLIIDYPSSDKNWVNCFYCKEAILVENFEFQYTAMVKGRGPRAKKEKKDFKILITIKPVSLIKVDEVMKTKHFINVLNKEMLSKQNFFQIGGSYFDLSTIQTHEIRIRSQAHAMGWVQGFKITTALLNKALGLQILPVMTRFQLRTVADELQTPGFKAMWMKSKKIFTVHNKVQYKIMDIDMTKKVTDVMDQESGKTFLQYFQEMPNLNDVYSQILRISNISNKIAQDQCMVKAVPVEKVKRGRQTRQVFLPPSLCILVDDPGKGKNFGMMPEVRTKNEMTPGVLMQRARGVIQKLMSNPDSCDLLGAYGVTLKQDTETVEAISCPPTALKIGKDTVQVGPSFRQNLTSFPPAASIIYRSEGGNVAGGLAKWGIIAEHDPRSLVGQLMDKLQKMSNNEFAQYNQIAQPRVQAIQQYGSDPKMAVGPYLQALNDLCGSFQCPAIEIQIVVVVLSGNKMQNEELYSQIKKWSYNNQVAVQCVLDMNIQKQEVICGLAQQIYAKAGGAVWEVVMPSENVYQSNTMVCGFDVSRPCTVGRNRVSAQTGFVSTVRDGKEHILSQTRPVLNRYQAGEIQQGGEMGEMINIAVEGWKRYNSNELPQRIVIYRDGVADGQLGMVLKLEVDNLVQQLQSIYSSSQVEFLFVVAQKNSSVRFSDEQGNLQSGSFVNFGCGEFTMVSQSVNPGQTPKPMRYIVARHVNISNGALQELTQDSQDYSHLIQLTNSLCYGYVNWPQAIQAPHILHLAHLLCRMSGEVLGRTANDIGLSDVRGFSFKPWFI